MVVQGGDSRGGLLRTLVASCSGRALEYSHPLLATDSDSKDDCCVCRVRGDGNAGRCRKVVLRLHREGGPCSFDDPASPPSECEDAAKLWEFLGDIHALPDEDPLAVAGESDITRERLDPISWLPFDGANVLRVLESSEAGPSRSHQIHPNILAPYAYFHAVHFGRTHALGLYPYVSRNLSSALKYSSRSFFDETSAKLILYQLARVLRFCHARGVNLGHLTATKFLIDDRAWLYALVDARAFHAEAKPRLPSPAPTPPPVLPGNDAEVVGATKNERRRRRASCSDATQDLAAALHAWRLGAMSNLDYILLLNLACGRERGNLAFYSIIPWVTDFKASPDPASDAGWRDLTRTKWRLAKGDEQLDMTYVSSDPPHHVSDEALSELTVCVYLARRLGQHVLTEVVRASFEPREYPGSIARVYEWTPDEAIPEFYDDPSIFESTHEGMANMALPAWAASPRDFIAKHRAALESDRVSAMLHVWIDLTFGYAVAGDAAVIEKNVHLQCKESCFPCGEAGGRLQMFSQPHPARKVATAPLQSALFAEEAAHRFAAQQLWFCKGGAENLGVGRGAEGVPDAEGSDVLFVCKVAVALSTNDVKDVLHADVPQCNTPTLEGNAKATQFTATFVKYARRSLEARARGAMPEVLRSPFFGKDIQWLYGLGLGDPGALGACLGRQGRLVVPPYVNSSSNNMYIAVWRFAVYGIQRNALASKSQAVSVLCFLLSVVKRTDCEKFMLPFLLQGQAVCWLLNTQIVLTLLEVLGEGKFFSLVLPRIFEQEKSAGPAVCALVGRLPLPIALRQIVEPLLTLLYSNQKAYSALIVQTAEELGGAFVRTHLYPRLIAMLSWAMSNEADRYAKTKAVYLRAQVPEMMIGAMGVLESVLPAMERDTILKTLVEDAKFLRGGGSEMQQPSVLFRLLLSSHPNGEVMASGARLLARVADIVGRARVQEKSEAFFLRDVPLSPGRASATLASRTHDWSLDRTSYAWLESLGAFSPAPPEGNVKVAPTTCSGMPSNIAFKTAGRVRMPMGRIHRLVVDEAEGLVVAAKDEVVKAWDLGSKEELLTVRDFGGINGTVSGLLTYSGRAVCVCDATGKIAITRRSTERMEFDVGAPAKCVARHGDRRVAVGLACGRVAIVDVSNAQPEASWRVGSAPLTSGDAVESIDVDGFVMCCGLLSGLVSVLDVRCGRPAGSFAPMDGPIEAVKSVGEYRLVSACRRNVRVWDIRAGRRGVLESYTCRDDVSGIFTLSSKVLVSVGPRLAILKEGEFEGGKPFKLRGPTGKKEHADIVGVFPMMASALAAVGYETGDVLFCN